MSDARTMTPPRAFEPSLRPVYGGLISLWLLLAVTLPARHLSIAMDELGMLSGLLIMLLWIAACLRMRGWVRGAMVVEASALLSIASCSFTILSFVAATTPAPLADGLMAGWDDRIFPGWIWPQIVLGFCRHTTLLAIADFCYRSIQWQGGLLILLCCLTGHRDRCATFILAWMTALAITIAIFAFVPCLGAYAHYGITAGQVPGIRWYRPDTFVALHSGIPLRITFGMLDGIIEFPSFHTAAAVLLAWGFWAIRWARWPAVALNGVMILSTIPVGGHYYIALPAGAIVAALGIVLAGHLRHWTVFPLRLARIARPVPVAAP